MKPIDDFNPSDSEWDIEKYFKNFNDPSSSDENNDPRPSSSYSSESSDWDLEDYKAYNEAGSAIMDSASSSSSSSLGTSSSIPGRHRLNVQAFFRYKKIKVPPPAPAPAPMEDVMNHHGSRVVFPTGGHPSQAVCDDLIQPVTVANLPQGLIFAKGLKNPLFVTPVEKKKSSFQTEAVRQLTGSLTKAEGLRFAIVVARFNEIVSKPLLKGALDTFKKYSVREEDIVVVWVPGCFEIGVVAEKLGKSGKYHAILCIGAVVRGDTTDYDVVANSAASGVLSAGLNSGVPCIFGVLTCEDMDKALSHAGGKAGNKGSEAALTAIEMASLFEHHLKE